MGARRSQYGLSSTIGIANKSPFCRSIYYFLFFFLFFFFISVLITVTVTFNALKKRELFSPQAGV